MKQYPLNKYHYIINGSKIYAITKDAGQTIRGTATCSPKDAFNLTTGKRIAASRANEKVATRRLKRASAAYEAAEQAVTEAAKKRDAAREFYLDAISQYNAARTEVEQLTK